MRSEHTGFALFEIVVSVGIVAASLFALSGTAALAYRATIEASNRVRAGFLLEENFEAIKTMRDRGWAVIGNLSLGQPYSPVFSNGEWTATTAPQTVGGFTRSFVVRETLRDASGDIASSGTSDADTRTIEFSVAWTERGDARVIEGMTYITNLFLE